MPNSQAPLQDCIQRMMLSEHYDPHRLLGLHHLGDHKVIRLWRPGVQVVFLEFKGKVVPAHQSHEAGLFELSVPKETTFKDYKIYHQNGLLAHDPYAFFPTFGEVDQHLFSKGTHYRLYEQMGGRLTSHQGCDGVKFTVWAPSAKRVSVVGDFNHWDGRVNPMRSLGACGVWELFVPGLQEGEKYKFEIKTQSGALLLKADPYALSSEVRPKTASVVANVSRFVWEDQAWMEERKRNNALTRPLNIYEVHLGSWKKSEDGERFLNYRELAHELGAYCQSMGFTHVELLPIAEHPLDESWGYQVSGYYAVTSRFGSPQDFQYFVNYLHRLNIGVIVDWVPGHFPTDEFALGRFDGTALYEHLDAKQGLHPHWSTLIFNFGRKEVSNFLIANALFWLDVMHVDGLRVDAVASMLYLDYGREEGQWIPNPYGGKENLEAIEFIKHTNSVVHQQFPGVLMIAEESTSFAGVTQPVDSGGLGFDFKWNMGWMNDTLRYFSKDMIFRHYHHQDLTFGLLYAFSEKFILVFSHDEVVHGKQHLLRKMPGDLWQKYANLRLLYSYMMCQPGKKLLFMGGEMAQWEEWSSTKSLDWHLLDYPAHQQMQNMVKDLNHFYLEQASFWEKDADYTGFEWVDFHDTVNSVICYLRKGHSRYFLCIHNFTPSYHPHYFVKLMHVQSLREVFNTDAAKYGGSGKEKGLQEVYLDAHGQRMGLHLALAPLATMIFEVHFSTT